MNGMIQWNGNASSNRVSTINNSKGLEEYLCEAKTTEEEDEEEMWKER
jgi:hypothetical protein